MLNVDEVFHYNNFHINCMKVETILPQLLFFLFFVFCFFFHLMLNIVLGK